MPFDSLPEPTPPRNEIVETIDKVIEILGPKGEFWCQKAFWQGYASYCVMGAIVVALGTEPRLISDWGGRMIGDDVQPIRRVLEDITLQPIEVWNDMPHRTFAEVRGLLNTARAKALIIA